MCMSSAVSRRIESLDDAWGVQSQPSWKISGDSGACERESGQPQINQAFTKDFGREDLELVHIKALVWRLASVRWISDAIHTMNLFAFNMLNSIELFSMAVFYCSALSLFGSEERASLRAVILLRVVFSCISICSTDQSNPRPWHLTA